MNIDDALELLKLLRRMQYNAEMTAGIGSGSTVCEEWQIIIK